MPLTFTTGERAGQIKAELPQAVVAHVRLAAGEDTLGDGQYGVLYDASSDSGFALALLAAVKENQRFAARGGEVAAHSTQAFEPLYNKSQAPLVPFVVGVEQSNTSVIYGDRFILKLFRRLEEGVSPDLEVGRFLTEKGFQHTPPLAGSLEYHQGEEPLTLAILQGFVPNEGDAWKYTLNSLSDYFRRVKEQPGPPHDLPTGQHLLDLAEREVPQEFAEMAGAYLDAARLLGKRTAEMHLTLASDASDPGLRTRTVLQRIPAVYI